MKIFQRKFRAFGLALLFGNSLLHAQFAATNYETIQAKVISIHDGLDARKFGFDVDLGLAGDPLITATKMLPPRILRANDDTGANLIPAKSQFFGREPSHVQFSWFIHLESPSSNATAIKELEVEFELFEPIEETPIITNVLMQPGGVITHPVLDKHRLKLTLLQQPTHNGATAPKNNLEFKVSDPQGALASLAFAKRDGTLLQPSLSIGSNTTNSRSDIIEYGFNQPLPDDLRLVVHLATPQRSQTVRCKLENIHLPWVDYPETHVTASNITRETVKSTNTYAWNIQLDFIGGQVGRSSGIRRLSVNLAKGNNGQDFRINEKRLLYSPDYHVAPLQNTGLVRRQASKWLPLETSAADVRFIRLLEGEAELFNPSAENGGLLEFSNFNAHPGEALNNQALIRSGVKLSFLGYGNFEAKQKEWEEHGLVLVQGKPPRKVAETVNDALMFSVDDPEYRIVSMKFFNKDGKWLPDGVRMVSSAIPSKSNTHLHAYCFGQPPTDVSLIRIQLATPESLQRIKFKVENIPLPL